LVVLFLVNLPFVSQRLTERKLERDGREVEATVLASRRVGDTNFVDYRLPEGIDPRGTRYSTQVDDATYEQARASKRLAVRVIPDDPTVNRADGAPRSSTFLVVALLGDVVLLVIALLWWRRQRRWNRFRVVEVGPGRVTLEGAVGTLTAAAPDQWTGRVRVGDHVSGSYHLVAEGDLFAGPPLSGLQRRHGAEYVVRGRVVDARAGWVVLEMEDGYRLRVETGPHRIRADIRDSTEATGVLCFTPR
jgi:hypothetical protein